MDGLLLDSVICFVRYCPGSYTGIFRTKLKRKPTIYQTLTVASLPRSSGRQNYIYTTKTTNARDIYTYIYTHTHSIYTNYPLCCSILYKRKFEEKNPMNHIQLIPQCLWAYGQANVQHTANSSQLDVLNYNLVHHFHYICLARVRSTERSNGWRDVNVIPV